jgi:hypothetical protein
MMKFQQRGTAVESYDLGTAVVVGYKQFGLQEGILKIAISFRYFSLYLFFFLKSYPLFSAENISDRRECYLIVGSSTSESPGAVNIETASRKFTKKSLNE